MAKDSKFLGNEQYNAWADDINDLRGPNVFLATVLEKVVNVRRDNDYGEVIGVVRLGDPIIVEKPSSEVQAQCSNPVWLVRAANGQIAPAVEFVDFPPGHKDYGFARGQTLNLIIVAKYVQIVDTFHIIPKAGQDPEALG